MSQNDPRFQQKKIDLEKESLRLDRARFKNELEALSMDRERLLLEKATVNREYAVGYGWDVEKRIIRLTEDIEQGSFEMFDTAMCEIEANGRKAITVKVSSYGGEVYEALSIIGRMQESKCQIITKGYGKIMSAATAILAAGDKRGISQYAAFMHHEAQIALEGGLDGVKNELRQQEQEEILWNRLMSDLTGVPFEFWANRGIGKNYYMAADDCLEFNIVDEVF